VKIVVPRIALVIASVSSILSVVFSAQAADVDVKWIASDATVVAERTMDLAALDSLPQAAIVTSTPWTEGKRRFSGPQLASLSTLAGGIAERALLRALNDFTAEVPSQDWTDLGIVLATRIDGKAPRVFEKGPFWLMYPVDTLPQPVEQKFLSRMIWQVDAITFYLK